MDLYKTVQDLQNFSKGREIYIWGAMIVGQGFCRAMERVGIKPHGFVDRSPALQGSRALGYEIQSPDTALALARAGKAGIIIGSGHHDKEIADICQSTGLIEGEGYLRSRHFCDIDPSVDIAGMCNLKCISCPNGNMKPLHQSGFMDAETYANVLKKLLDELPLMGNIQLYTWGEPFLNRQLPEIIRITRQSKVLCALSTNLNTRRDFREIIAAKPDWLKISISGHGPNYAVTHTGGSWPLLLDNLHRLRSYHRQYHPDMHVVVNYHLYKRNLGEEYRQMRRLCKKLGFVFRPNHAYLYPMDNIMDYVEGRPLSENAQRTMEMLLMDIDSGLLKARRKKERPCPEQRCFPINWDLRVRLCGVYYRPFIESNFLKTTVRQVIDKRKACGFCNKCQKMALHHFTGVYLEEAIDPGCNAIIPKEERSPC